MRLGDFAIEGGEAGMSSLFSVAGPEALALLDGAALTFIVKADHETDKVSASGQSNSVTLAAAPMLTVIKTVVRNNGGTAVAGS